MNASVLLQPIVDIYELGGFVVLILAVLSVVALSIVLLKLWQFAREGVGRRQAGARAVEAFVRGDASDALAIAEGGKGPVASIVAASIRGAMSTGTAMKTIEEDVQRIATERLHALASGLRLLEAIAQIAPLLGLFGTVLGMIEAFQAMQSAGADIDPSQLAGGIWVALLTTAVGLAVAMPSQLLTTWFDGRIENERVAMETAVAAIFTRRITDRRGPIESPAVSRQRPALQARAGLAPGE